MARFISDTGVLMRGRGESAPQVSEPVAMRETGNGFANGHSPNTYGTDTGAPSGATPTASAQRNARHHERPTYEP